MYVFPRAVAVPLADPKSTVFASGARGESGGTLKVRWSWLTPSANPNYRTASSEANT